MPLSLLCYSQLRHLRQEGVRWLECRRLCRSEPTRFFLARKHAHRITKRILYMYCSINTKSRSRPTMGGGLGVFSHPLTPRTSGIRLPGAHIPILSTNSDSFSRPYSYLPGTVYTKTGLPGPGTSHIAGAPFTHETDSSFLEAGGK